MIKPTKHQKLKTNILVIGAEILILLKKEELLIEELFIKTSKKTSIALDMFLDTITYLWLMNFIDIKKEIVKLNVSK